MDPIKTTIRINQEIEVEIDPDDILERINELTLPQKWNYIGHFINNIELSITEMSDAHKKIIRDYLESKLKLFEGN